MFVFCKKIKEPVLFGASILRPSFEVRFLDASCSGSLRMVLRLFLLFSYQTTRGPLQKACPSGNTNVFQVEAPTLWFPVERLQEQAVCALPCLCLSHGCSNTRFLTIPFFRNKGCELCPISAGTSIEKGWGRVIRNVINSMCRSIFRVRPSAFYILISAQCSMRKLQGIDVE